VYRWFYNGNVFKGQDIQAEADILTLEGGPDILYQNVGIKPTNGLQQSNYILV
jgi:hypothetical protein